jgi:hypothetical protein
VVTATQRQDCANYSSCECLSPGDPCWVHGRTQPLYHTAEPGLHPVQDKEQLDKLATAHVEGVAVL